MSRSSAALILFMTVIGLAACSWFDDVNEETLDVSYEEDFDTDIPIDANALCPAGTDCSGMAIPAPMDQSLQAIDVHFDVNIVEQTMRPELQDYAGKFKSIQITKITYEAKDNDLTIDVPPLTLYLGPLGSEKVDGEGVLELATLPMIPAGESKVGDATINTEKTQELSALIQSLQVATLAKAEPKVKAGQPFPPSGDTELKITIFVKFVANPADIARKSQ